MDASSARRERPRQITTRVYLFGLVAAVLVPLLLFAAFLIVQYAGAERIRYEREAVQIARQTALLLDGELEGHVALLRGLAASSALENDDFAKLYEEAKRLVAGRDQIIVLRQIEPVQILNTERPYGSALPPAVPLSPAEVTAFTAGRSIVSDVYTSPTSGLIRIAVGLPIIRERGPLYILAITFPTSHIHDALAAAVPPGWIVTIGDKRGVIVTRSVRHDEFSGKSGRPEYLEQAVGQSGTFTAHSFDDYRLLTGYYRSDHSGWLFGANIPEAVVEGPLWRSLIGLAALGAAALGISALLAYLFGTTFTTSTAGLADRATALGDGRHVSPMPSRLREFAHVSEALAHAAASIESRSRERELLLNELNHRVKNTLVTVQSIVRQTLRGSSSMNEASESVSSRLIALAQAHDVLTRESWEGAELHDLAFDVLRPHGFAERITCEGPRIWLPPALSLSLALALHELATNAAKYGSLSKEGGTVAVTWHAAEVKDCPGLVLHWTERDGPPVAPPTRQGFGTRLIQRSLSAAIGGTVNVDYRPDGLVCTIEAPLSPPEKTPTAAVAEESADAPVSPASS